MKKILVCGGRSFFDYKKICQILDQFISEEVIIIHGGASGADALANIWAITNNKEIREYKANWDKYGKAAGPIRNSKMLEENPNIVIAFPGGRGTADMVFKSKQLNIKVIEVKE